LPEDAEQDLDGEEARLLIALLLLSGQHEAAAEATRKLHQACGDWPAVHRWLTRMEAPGYGELSTPAEPRIEHLAGELLPNLEVIPSLVAAQQHQPEPEQIALLRHALARLAPGLGAEHPRMLTICRAQARLSLLAGDPDEARRWAHRGLKLAPDDEKLALALAEVEDDPAVGPPAKDVLATVCERHPDYPDVRRARIRREHRDGDPRSARQLLAHWLQTEPNSPIAQTLEKELAA
jgi:hypothetical protein